MRANGQGGVVQCERRRARHGAGHVGDAVMEHVVDHEGRVGVRRGLAGLDAAALVDRDVDDHRACLHAADHVASDELRRRARPAISTAPITRSASITSASMCSLRRVSVRSVAPKIEKFAQAVH